MVITKPHLFEFPKPFLGQCLGLLNGILFVLMTVLGEMFLSEACGQEKISPDRTVAVLYELKRPFVEAMEGLVNVIKTAGIAPNVFIYDEYPGKKQAVLKERMLKSPFGCYIGVGPRAAKFIWNEADLASSLKVYTMVLNPEKVLPKNPSLCGVSLNIPVQTQVREIVEALPHARHLGLMFDPAYNASFYFQSKQAASEVGRRITPLMVSSGKEIPAVLQRSLEDIDALWMIPDPTVIISERIIQYIIEQAFLNGKPVIGYNTFFYESGALMNFIFNYGELGEQTGELVLEILKDGVCRRPDPAFSIWINRGVAQKLDIVLRVEGQTQDVTEP